MSLILNKDNPLATKVRTRDGEPLRIICVDAPGPFPIIAIGSNGRLLGYSMIGNNCSCDTRNDLINIVEKQKWFLNVYPTGEPTLHSTKDTAEACAARDRLRCVEVEI